MHSYDKAQLEFLALIRGRNFVGVAQLIQTLVEAGHLARAAALLRDLAEMSPAVTVTQQAGTVEAGATVIGYQG